MQNAMWIRLSFGVPARKSREQLVHTRLPLENRIDKQVYESFHGQRGQRRVQHSEVLQFCPVIAGSSHVLSITACPWA